MLVSSLSVWLVDMEWEKGERVPTEQSTQYTASMKNAWFDIAQRT